MNKFLATVFAGTMLSGFATFAVAENKIGFVSTERVFRDSTPAVKAVKKIEKEFEKRDQDLQKMSKQIQSMQESMEKNAVTMSDADRRNKDRELADLNREFQRRQREFREDLNQRKNEEFSVVLERANKAIKAIAEADKYDIIFQDVVYANPRIDITDKVLKSLNDGVDVPAAVAPPAAPANLKR